MLRPVMKSYENDFLNGRFIRVNRFSVLIFKKHIIHFTLTLFFFIPYCLSSQDNLEVLFEQAQALKHQSPDSAASYFQIVDSLAIIQRDTVKQKAALIFLGGYYSMNGGFQIAKLMYERLLPLVNNPREELTVNTGYAKVIANTDYKKADSLYLRGLEIIENNKFDVELSGYYGYYSMFLNSIGKFPEAIKYYQKGIEVVKHPLPEMSLNAHLARILMITGNVKQAEEYAKKAIEIGDENNFKTRNGMVAVIYADWLIRNKKYQHAANELNKAIPYLKNKQQKDGWSNALVQQMRLLIAQNQLQQADVVRQELNLLKPDLPNKVLIGVLNVECLFYLHMKNYQAQLSIAKQMLTLTKEFNNPFFYKEAHWHLNQAYKALGNKAAAYDHLSAYEVLSDSLFRLGQSQLVSQLEAEYKRKEQDQQIVLLDSQNKIKAIALAQQKKVILGASIGLALISILSFLLYSFYKRVNKQKEQLAKAVEEKDMLLREIHHRVKNNLQIVTSLLNLQSKSIKDPKAISAINEGKARVRSMAIIHQSLYLQEKLTGINMKSYLESLCEELFSAYDISQDKIKLHLAIDNIDLDIDTIVPLGLIINELITNVLKHAFPAGVSGNLWIKLAETNDKLVLDIKDDGIGFDQGEINRKTFGNTLIRALTDQLEGKIAMNLNKGAQISIKFLEYKKVA